MAVVTLGSPSFDPAILEEDYAVVEGAPIEVVGGGDMTAMVGESDPIFSAWDKHTGITIHPSQIIPDDADITPLGLAVSSHGLDTAPDGSQSAYVVLAWTAISSSTFDHYVIRYKKTASSSYNYINAPTNSIELEGLIPGVEYGFSIASVNKSSVTSAYSTPAVTHTMSVDTTAPGTVTGLTATAGIESVTLTWTNSADYDLASYNIYRNTTNDSAGSSLIANVSSNIFHNVGLNGGDPYYYWIKAKDTSGNLSASYSDEAHTTTLTTVPIDILAGVLYINGQSIGAINPTTGEINANKVGTTQLQLDSITSAHINDNAITAAKLSVAAINASGNITEAAVGTLQIATGGIEAANIANDAITASAIADNAVLGPAISSDAILARHILAGEIKADHIATGALTARHMTAANFVIIDKDPVTALALWTSNDPEAGEVSWVNCSVMYNGVVYAITDGHCPATDSYIYWEFGDDHFSTSVSLPTLTSDDFLVATNSSGTHTLVWNATIINGNRITTGSISTTHLAANSIVASKIAAGAITADKIAANAITANKIVSYNFQLIGKVLTGSINPIASTDVTGVDTLFLSEVIANDYLLVSNEIRKVASVISNTSLTVTEAFSDNANDTSPVCITPNIFQNNTPSAGRISWPACKVTYGGIEYTVVAGNCLTTDFFIYWDKSYLSGAAFGKSASLPELSDDGFIVATNGNGLPVTSEFYNLGTAVYVWNSTTVNGNRITTGSITTSLLQAGCITADKIGVGAITAEKIDAGAITAEKIDAGAITAEKITAGVIDASKLSFTPTDGTNVIATINASSEGLAISAAKINISGDCNFSSGFDPRDKNRTFASASQPTAIAVGDLWIHTDSDPINQLYRCSSLGPPQVWDAVRDAGIVDMTTFLAELDAISNDDVISRSEKPRIVSDYNNILTMQTSLVSQADTFGVSHAAFDTVVAALTTYLVSPGLTPAYNNFEADTTLAPGNGTSGAVFRATFEAVLEAAKTLQIAIGGAQGNWVTTSINGGIVTTGTLKVGSGAFVNAGITGNGETGASIRFWAGDTEENKTIAPFRVDDDGNLTSTSGDIGGFTISAGNGLYSGSGVTHVHMKPGVGFWAGNDTFASAPFHVDQAGTLTASGVASIGTATQVVGGLTQSLALYGPQMYENAYDANGGCLYLNTIGFNGGTTRYRTTVIGNGKGDSEYMVVADGLNNKVAFSVYGIPQMPVVANTTVMNALPNPTSGMIVYCTDGNHFWGYCGGSWKTLDNM